MLQLPRSNKSTRVLQVTSVLALPRVWSFHCHSACAAWAPWAMPKLCRARLGLTQVLLVCHVLLESHYPPLTPSIAPANYTFRFQAGDKMETWGSLAEALTSYSCCRWQRQSLSQAPEEFLLDGGEERICFWTFADILAFKQKRKEGVRVSCHSAHAFLPAMSQAAIFSCNCSAVQSSQQNKTNKFWKSRILKKTYTIKKKPQLLPLSPSLPFNLQNCIPSSHNPLYVMQQTSVLLL